MVLKYTLFVLLAIVLTSCNQKQSKAVGRKSGQSYPKLVLSGALESRRPEFQANVDSARRNIITFSKKYGWEALTEDEFVDSVMIFDDKDRFNRTLLKLAGLDSSMEVPDTYCAALERKVLVSVTPEFYARVYPQGVEARFFEKLLTHEIAHRLHVRILNGNEEAMGPVWFYEGFAIFAAGQFSDSKVSLTREEMIAVMKETERSSYLQYNYIFRYFVHKIPLAEMLNKAKSEDFNDELIRQMD